MTAKYWGRAISGPILAGAGLVLLFAQLTVTDAKDKMVLSCLGWSVLGLAVLLVFMAQYEVWKQERSDRLRAEGRLKPKAVVRNLTPRVWPAGQGGVGVTGKEYYFDVFNCSEAEALENVRAEISELTPDAIGYPNVPLHIRNEEYDSPREFSINAMSVRQIDLITGPVNAPNSQQVMIIPHTVNRYRTEIPKGTYRVTVRISSKNSPPTLAAFKTWIDDSGELQCVTLALPENDPHNASTVQPSLCLP